MIAGVVVGAGVCRDEGLRDAGFASVRDIAGRLGVTRQTVHRKHGERTEGPVPSILSALAVPAAQLGAAILDRYRQAS
jgi:hypothetical protein